MIDHYINLLHFQGDPVVAHILSAVWVLLIVILLWCGIMCMVFFHIRPASERNRILDRFLTMIMGIAGGIIPTLVFLRFFVLDALATSVVLIFFISMFVSMGFALCKKQPKDANGSSF